MNRRLQIAGLALLKKIRLLDLHLSRVIGNIKIVNGENGLFVSMPNYSKDGEYKDICYPTTASFRNKISNAVIEKYQEVSKNKEQNRSQNEPENDRPRHKSR